MEDDVSYVEVVSGKINYELLDTMELNFVAFDEALMDKLNLGVNLFVVLVEP